VSVKFAPTGAAGTKTATLTASNGAGTQSVTLTGTATAVPPQQPPTGTPTVSPATAAFGGTLTAARGTLADPNGIASVTWQWQSTGQNNSSWADISGATGQTFALPGILQILTQRCKSYRVMATVHDNLGKAELAIASAATGRLSVGGNGAACSAPPALAAATTAPALTPLGQASAPRTAPAPLAARSLRVTSSTSAPIAVAATVPAGANTVAITVFRLGSVIKRTGAGRHAPSTVDIATVYRRASKARRYVFRLTERPFRHLRPGRYLIQVRVGTSRTALGPVASRQITIRRGRSSSAR